MEVTFAGTNREGDARLVEQVHLTDTLTLELDRALDELDDVHLRLAKAEERIRTLHAMMTDDLKEEPEEMPEIELPHSPSRKKLCLDAALLVASQDLSEGDDSS